MKSIYILLVLSLTLHISDAQRRTSVVKNEASSTEAPQRPVGRGRVRFTSPPDFSQTDEPKSAPQTPPRQILPRRRPESAVATERPTPKPVPVNRRKYEVIESVDEIPSEPIKRPGKSRVLSESQFNTNLPPKRHQPFRPRASASPVELDVDELLKSIGTFSQHSPKSTTPTSSTTVSVESNSDEATLEEITTNVAPSEPPKMETEVRVESSTLPSESKKGGRRGNFRTRARVEENSEESAPNGRVRRVKATRRPVESPSTAPHATRIISRGSRRSSVDSGPSVFSAEETQALPIRVRAGRRIDSPAPEKISFDLSASTKTRTAVRKVPVTTSTERSQSGRLYSAERTSRFSTTQKSSSSSRNLAAERNSRRGTTTSTEKIESGERVQNGERNSRRRTGSRFQGYPSSSTTRPTVNTIRSRSRTRPALQFDERKLEVLPLFESEPKTVRPLTHSKSSFSKKNVLDETVQFSATENDVKFIKPEVKNKLDQTEKPTVAPKSVHLTRQSNVRQSVVSHITEVTSKRTVSRRRNLSTEPSAVVKVDPPKISVSQVVSRGRKKSEVKLSKVGRNKTLSSSEEEIDESDNYPEAFKALLQAKKKQQESRPVKVHGVSSSTSADAKVVTSSEASSTTIAASTSTTIRPRAVKDEELDNELVPKVTTTTAAPFRITRKRTTSTPRSYRHRQTLPTRSYTHKTITSASTEKAAASIKEYRFHAKVNATTKFEPNHENSLNKSTPKPRGIYSSKNTYKSHSTKKPIESRPVSTQIPKSESIRKSNRYSSRYRNEFPSRGLASRSTTSAPAYIPTIPTAAYIPTVPAFTLSTSTVKLIEGTKDTDLGVEVITFDDPVNTVPSANLVSGEYLSSSNDAQNNVVPVVTNKATEKPVSIIERIINSLTAISTTASPESKTQTVSPKIEQTTGSAILKLATKKPTKSDTTADQNDTIHSQTSTSEKPTTVIERILNSLTAIQANDIDQSNFLQVGNDFNTISFPSTTPLSRVTKSAITTLSAPTSTINPLSVLDGISEEQILEKRTIGKLLQLLNGLTTTASPRHTTKLVVVTPKPNTYISAGYGSTTTPYDFTQTSTFPSSTSSELFTSPNLSPSSIDVRFNTLDGTTPTEQSNTKTTPPPTTTPQPTTTPPSSGTTANERTTPVNTNTPAGTTANEPATTPASTEKTFTYSPSILSLLPFFASTTGPNQVDTTDNFDALNSISSSTENGFTDTDPIYSISSTIPSLRHFEVSPGSVSVYSANDLSNTITTDDNLFSTVTIASRNNVDTATTESSTQSSDSTTVPADNSTGSVNETDSTTIPPVEMTMMSLNMSKNANISINDGNSTMGTSSSSMSDNSNQTVANNVTANSLANRSGRLLSTVPDPVQNSIDTSTPDYFIFAVLPNNTILRKRPSSFPTKETPFLIVGVYPNNTIVRKFPNGTIVPMEPIIRVRGFDTRENPPPLPEITSNQVTNEPGSPPDNTNVKTVDDSPLAPNVLTLSTAKSPTSQATTTANSTETVTETTTQATTTTNSPMTTASASTAATKQLSTTASPTTKPTIPTLSNLLNGRTVEAFNEIINNSNAAANPSSNREAKKLDDSAANQWNQVLNIQDLLNKNIDNNVLVEAMTRPTDNFQQTTTPAVSTTVTTTSEPATTTPAAPKLKTSAPATTVEPSTFRTTTGFPTTTFFPTWFSTILSTVQPRYTTTPTHTTPVPTTLETEAPTRLTTQTTVPTSTTPTQSPTTVLSRGKLGFADTLTTTTTDTPLTTVTRRHRSTTTTPFPTTILSTLPPSTPTRRIRTTTTTEPSTILYTSPLPKLESTTKKLKELTEEQKKNLEMVAQLEREQSALLQQLSLLTSLGLGGNGPKDKDGRTTTPRNNLANRIIALAMERDKSKLTTPPPKSIQDVLLSGTRDSRKLSENSNNKQPALEDVLKQYDTAGLNLDKKPSVPPTYGKSNDAILAALLKEQGIGPTTPKGLQNIYAETTTTTRRPRTTRPPSRLMQGLNWLLNALAPPPTTKRPKPKPKKKPKNQEEILSNQPTHITPVVTAAPNSNNLSPNALSQDDIKKLIKQLEAVQKDPKNNDLDLTQIKSIQHLINADEGVQIITPSGSGSTSRANSGKPKSKSKSKTRTAKSTTISSTTLDNSLDFEEESHTTEKAKVKLPPVRLRPVPGIDGDGDSDPLVRSNLITAAVNVTRAISSFLGSALQGAATSFRSLVGSGSRLVGNYVQGSSSNSNG